MHKHQQQLFLFALFISITYAKITINSFDAKPNTELMDNQPTVHANHIMFVDFTFLFSRFIIYIYL
jgi:hypothetical protein